MARRKKGVGRSARNARKNINPEALEEEYKKCPHSFVLQRGHVGKNVSRLVLDMRRVMEPFTATNLKVTSRNVLKDFFSVAGPLNVTHLITFSKSEVATYLRIIRLPRGPTMTFKVHEFSLGRDVVSSLKRNQATQSQYLHHPLLVMNHFSGDGMHLKLMATMFQNMFPSINVNKLKLNDVKRCVLLNYNQEDKTIDFRHYNIRVVPVGMSKAVKKLVRGQVPNLGSYNDISDYVLRENLSESEMEVDGPHNEVELPQDLPGRGNVKSAKSAIRLTEIGPRMKLQLIKIEEGVCSGEVLFHEYVEKSPEELKALKEMRENKRKLKESRKRKQAENVERKQALKEELKKKSLEGMKRKETETKATTADAEAASDDYDSGEEMRKEEEDDDDVEYFRQEVGQDPDPDTFTSRKSTNRTFARDWKKKVNVYTKSSNREPLHKSKIRNKFVEQDRKQKTQKRNSQRDGVEDDSRKRKFPFKQNDRKSFPHKKRK